MYRYFVLVLSVLLSTGLCERNSKELISSNYDGRIVGGSTVNITDYPYMVSIRYISWTGQLVHICGGCIYNEKIIITANHCVDNLNSYYMKIRIGSQYHNKGGQLIDVDRIISHENYNRITLNNDIALIQLKNPIKFSETVSPINLPNSDTIIPTGTKANISGWGVMQEGNRKIPDKLRAVQVEVSDKKECERRYGALTDQMLCAGVPEGGKDSCQGDSGGPLVVKRILIGIVSWGYGCARMNYPGVYTNILNLFTWINKNVS